MAKVNYSNSAIPQASELIREVKRNDKTIPKLLWDLLHLATPHGTEQHIIDLLPFRDRGVTDKEKNFILKIGENPETMFSCHMDTVHTLPKELKDTGNPGYIRLLTMNDDSEEKLRGYLWAGVKNRNDEKFTPCVLGADDKIGVFIMCELIERKIPGLYIFHAGEECGAPGSRFAAAEYKNTYLKGIKRCIAFDRRGYNDVISFQRGQRRCSKVFAAALADAINKNIMIPNDEFKFKGEAEGTFTDSCNYSDIIPECTNISIGYFDQHTSSEKFDYLWFFTNFMPALMQVKWDELPTERDVTKIEYKWQNSSHYNGGYHSGINTGYNKYNGWGDGKVVPLGEVTKDTKEAQVPRWEPKEGYLLGASREGMRRILDCWMSRNYQERATLTEGLMFRMEELEMELELARSENASYKALLNIKEDVPTGKEVHKEPLVQGPNNVIQLPDLTRKEEDNLPKDITFWNAAVKNKQDIIETFITYKDVHSTAIPKAYFHILTGLHRQYRKISKRIRNTSSCSRNDYTALNSIIFKLTEVFISFPDGFKTEETDKACHSAMNYIRLNEAEPGFEALKEPLLPANDKAFDVVH
jgi:hypothetical protein